MNEYINRQNILFSSVESLLLLCGNNSTNILTQNILENIFRNQNIYWIKKCQATVGHQKVEFGSINVTTVKLIIVFILHKDPVQEKKLCMRTICSLSRSL